jgi:uncharacterized OB-fold protein
MGTLGATGCRCGKVYIPPKERCLECISKTKPIDIDDSGELLTFTVLQATPEGFTAPLILGLIRLDGSNEETDSRSTKLLCEGKVPEPDLSIGLKVKVRLKNGKYYFIKNENQ